MVENNRADRATVQKASSRLLLAFCAHTVGSSNRAAASLDRAGRLSHTTLATFAVVIFAPVRTWRNW